MRVDPSQDHAEARDASRPPLPAPDERASRVGYGHRAHCPDPKAKYGFDPGVPRTMPHDPSKRWRVTG